MRLLMKVCLYKASQESAGCYEPVFERMSSQDPSLCRVFIGFESCKACLGYRPLQALFAIGRRHLSDNKLQSATCQPCKTSEILVLCAACRMPYAAGGMTHDA